MRASASVTDEDEAVEKLLPLARMLAVRFVRTHRLYTLDEAVSHAQEGVLQAVREYVPSRCLLKTLAGNKAWWRMIDAYRRDFALRTTEGSLARRLKRPVMESVLPINYMNKLARDSDHMVQVDMCDLTCRLMVGLTVKEVVILRRYVMGGEQMEPVAADLGLRANYCWKLLRHLLNRLRNRLEAA